MNEDRSQETGDGNSNFETRSKLLSSKLRTVLDWKVSNLFRISDFEFWNFPPIPLPSPLLPLRLPESVAQKLQQDDEEETNTDDSIYVKERDIHSTQVVGTHQPMLVGEQYCRGAYPGKVNRAKMRPIGPVEAKEKRDHHEMADEGDA